MKKIWVSVYIWDILPLQYFCTCYFDYWPFLHSPFITYLLYLTFFGTFGNKTMFLNVKNWIKNIKSRKILGKIIMAEFSHFFPSSRLLIEGNKFVIKSHLQIFLCWPSLGGHFWSPSMVYISFIITYIDGCQGVDS